MKSTSFNRGFARAVFIAAVAITVIGGSAGTGAWAAGDEDEQESLDTKIVRNLLQAFGLRRDDEKAGIEYRERSPLVLPSGSTLPPPENSDPATKTAGWPDDPDVKRDKQRKTERRNRKAYVEGVDDRPLLPSDIQAKGNVPSRTTSRGGEAPGRSIEETSKPASLTELGSKSIFSKLWAPKDEYTTFTGEPRRESLVEPPAGYRTPSPNQPFGVGREKAKAQSAEDRSLPAR